MYQIYKKAIAIFLFSMAGMQGVALADSPSANDPRPQLETFSNYDDFQKALQAWQDRQSIRRGESPSVKGALSDMDIQKLRNAFKPHPILVAPPPPPPPPRLETIDSAVKAAKADPHKNTDKEKIAVSSRLHKDDQLDATVIPGALGATAAGGNAPVVQSKLQNNVDNQNAIDYVSAQQKPGQQNTAAPTSGGFLITTPEGTSSLPSSAAVNVIQRSMFSTNGTVPIQTH